MTPIRAKRNSKAPDRFSSDDIKTDQANAPSNQSNGDKSSSSTKIKLRPIIREPLKVKLPKLRRPQTMQSPSQVNDSLQTDLGGSFAKIKLPTKRNIQRRDATSGSAQKLSKETSPSTDDQRGIVINQSSDLRPLSLLKKIDDPERVDESFTNQQSDSKEEQKVPLDEVDSKLEAPTSCSSFDMTTGGKEAESSIGSGIRCPCGVDDDLGVMVECEKCSNWQHGHCINVGPEEDAYEGYVCAYCLLPPGCQNDTLQQLVLNDKLRSKFEALEASMKYRNGDTHDFAGSNTATESMTEFSYDELEMATFDLRRVSNSLEVKCKLLINDDYNAELKIWKNPIWSDDPEENRKQEKQTVRFVGDIYKSNLRLNICNMLNRMHKRCQLIRYQISRSDTSEQELQSKYDKLLVILDGIARLVEEVTDNLKTV